VYATIDPAIVPYSGALIGFRALPGEITEKKQVFSTSAMIAKGYPDSFYRNGVYVIGRSCQTLPCFSITMQGR
jgi:hypothetical protein